jgi:hypothetical protein
MGTKAATAKRQKVRPAFRIYFNKRKQWFDVYIADNPRKFMNENKCWAYYQPANPRHPRRGLFGVVHFSRIGAGLVSHELLHLLIDWTFAYRKTFKFTDRNEERIVEMFGEMVRQFYVRYWSWKEHTSI